MNKILMIAAMLLLTAQLACGQSGGDGKNAAKTDESQALADRITESTVPVFVDFWASWCGACRMLEPTLAEIKKEYGGRVNFIRVDVDVHRGLTQYFGVTAMPTVFVIEDKTVRAAMQGVRQKGAYTVEIDKALTLAKERGSKKD
ncbi:MAG: thioredoxin domain-containing protein [Chitinispirillia bacterium]|nr:thioredoxin domain-containing protein [Chitinispirillia bacterium]MCL2242444.1 thioredoxin domain-containing protein [Chitinispirillia bacterium]